MNNIRTRILTRLARGPVASGVLIRYLRDDPFDIGVALSQLILDELIETSWLPDEEVYLYHIPTPTKSQPRQRVARVKAAKVTVPKQFAHLKVVR